VRRLLLVAGLFACGQPLLPLPDSGTPDSGTTDAGSCTLPNTSTVSVNVCPSGDPCPDCSGTVLADGTYFQTKGPAVFGSACGSCQPKGTLRIASGVIDMVLEELADICTQNGALQTRTHATFTQSGSTLHLHDTCGQGDFELTAGVSADAGLLELTPVQTGSGGGGAGNAWDRASLFQRQ
jgi:hypothetical protein